MQIEKRIGREKKRCGYAPFNSAQQAIKLRSLRSLRPSGKLPSATCFIAGPLGRNKPGQNKIITAAERKTKNNAAPLKFAASCGKNKARKDTGIIPGAEEILRVLQRQMPTSGTRLPDTDGGIISCRLRNGNVNTQGGEHIPPLGGI